MIVCRLVFACLIVIAVLALDIGPAAAQSGGAAAAEPSAPKPEDLRALADLLAKPEIQAWLRNPTAVSPEPAKDSTPSLQLTVSNQVNAARSQFEELVKTAPEMPRELAQARLVLMDDLRARPILAILLPFLFFACLGLLLEWIYWRTTGGLRRVINVRWAETPSARMRGVVFRLLYGLGEVAAFAVGSVGAFMAFDWAPLLQRFVINYLLAFLVIRFAYVLGRVVLARKDERYRLLPMSGETAAYWVRWWTIIVGVFAFGQCSIDLLPALRMDPAAQHFVQLAFSLTELTLSLVAIWRAPCFDGTGRVWRRHTVATWVVTLYGIALWLSSFTGNETVFHVGLILLAVGFAIRGVRLAVDHIFRPAEEGTASAAEERKSRPVIAVAVDRGLCAILLVIGAYMIASAIGIDLNHLAAGETWPMRLGRGAVNAAIILLVADCVWQMAKAYIDRKLAEATSMARVYGEEARRRARVRTLLPVVRNIFWVVLIVIAGLMALAALGVDIGPLIAGAGVVGVAVGFGAQTLVKDIISGIFFLFDDAFRTGEYIESGAISGTVEAFSVRSVKLRHALGALHTIPLGTLNTITNYSRDWAVDQMMVNVTYDTDLDKVRQIVGDIGRALNEDPAFEPYIIEPLNLQGVENFGEYAIKICLRMMTKPGEQHAIRRKAYAMLKTAFDENGISFAFPTVKVAGDGEPASAAARKGLELVQAGKPTAKA